MLALTAFALWLGNAQSMGAITNAGYDDGLYLSLAQHLVDGAWLGPLNLITLLKPPGYPLWIAANHFVGVPLHLSEHALYAAACALFVSAIRPVLPSPWARVALFALLLFQPMALASSTLRYVRDALYTAQVLGFTACLVGLVTFVEAPLRKIWQWSVAAGLIAGGLWLVRDENVVLAPAIAVAALMIGAHLWRRRPVDWLSRVLAMAAAVPIAASLLLPVAWLNYRHYGFFGVSEFRSRPLNDAMGALATVDTTQHRRWVIVARETRERIYAQSAAFRELQPVFAVRQDLWGAIGPVMFDWDQKVQLAEMATGTLLDTACQENVAWDDAAMKAEIMTGWFVLALREAVELAGYFTVPQRMEYLSRLAAEVNDACEAGTLTCRGRRSSLAPPWRWDDLGLTLRRTCRGTARLLVLFDTPFTGSYGTPEQLASVERLTGDRVVPMAGAPAPAPPSGVDRWRLDALAAIRRVFVAVTPALAVAAMAGLMLAVVRRRGRQNRTLLGVALILLVALAARHALLAYMDTTAFPFALNGLYMLPLYPLMYAWFAVSCLAGWRAVAGSTNSR